MRDQGSLIGRMYGDNALPSQ